MLEKAQSYLQRALNNPQANFREGQQESIDALLQNKRVLVVQRTGWGKSIVYFLATKMLRDNSSGPSLLISPLLSLMRDQIKATEGIGVNAKTINSSNEGEWETIKNELLENNVDLLMISPERFASDDFMQNIFPAIGNIGLLAIDEAHCISDWGHEFRPDYKRIKYILDNLPPNIPVIATTATANDRVVADIKEQLGENIELQRGTLLREGLQFYNIKIPKANARMAWLVKNLPNFQGSGIIYTLTKREAEQVADWLQNNNIDAHAYHAGENINRPELETKLLNNEIKVLVSTIALGMGFDKPDLEFVIHYQRPSSVVSYYQQAGRAGRAIEKSYAILLNGEGDDEIANYFIEQAFPAQGYVEKIIEVIGKSENGLSLTELEKLCSLRPSQIKKAIKFMLAESPSPIIKDNSTYYLAASGADYKINQEYVKKITDIRKKEQDEMQQYMAHSDCLMNFLQNALDDEQAKKCGICMNCTQNKIFDANYHEKTAIQASDFLRKNHQKIPPRKQWPEKNIFERYQDISSSRNIPKELQAEEGRALCQWLDAGWGETVDSNRYQDKHLSDELVDACVEMFVNWNLEDKPEWITCVPSLRNSKIVPDFSKRFAQKTRLPFIPCVEQVVNIKQQKHMRTRFEKVKNLDGAFIINKQCIKTPCLLIDDIVNSRWTFTVISALLRQSGCSTVYPMALANSNNDGDSE